MKPKLSIAVLLVAALALGMNAQEKSAQGQDAQEQGAQPATTLAPAGKRDPFRSPIARRTEKGMVSICATGKRCLQADDVVLKGIVRGPETMIAVVENSAKRTYFLRENDAIMNGYVFRITGDSVVFRENAIDRFGKVRTREVVKRVNAPAV